MEDAARSGDARQPAKGLSRSVMTAADRAAAQPTASQAFGRSLTRSAPGQTAQAAKAGDPQKRDGFVRSAAANTMKAAPGAQDARMSERSSSDDANRAAQPPMAVQRKWDPSRSLEASPAEDLQDL
jgi:hypothetical protein